MTTSRNLRREVAALRRRIIELEQSRPNGGAREPTWPMPMPPPPRYEPYQPTWPWPMPTPPRYEPYRPLYIWTVAPYERT